MHRLRLVITADEHIQWARLPAAGQQQHRDQALSYLHTMAGADQLLRPQPGKSGANTWGEDFMTGLRLAM